jgi:hypothetical protein
MPKAWTSAYKVPACSTGIAPTSINNSQSQESGIIPKMGVPIHLAKSQSGAAAGELVGCQALRLWGKQSHWERSFQKWIVPGCVHLKSFVN